MSFDVFYILQGFFSFFVAFSLLDDNNTQFAKLIEFASDLESSTEKRWQSKLMDFALFFSDDSFVNVDA